MRYYTGLIFFIFLQIQNLPILAGELNGTVTDASDNQALPGVNILLKNTSLGATTDSQGNYAIRAIPQGSYHLEIRLMGYRTTSYNIQIPAHGTVTQHVMLKQDILSLEEIVVTPGRFSMLSQNPVVPQTLSREEIQAIPQFGDDIYRVISRLPGVTGSDFSSRFSIRGGEHDQVLVTLDGMELSDPFHMKDVEGGGLSIVDTDIIGGIEVIAGGFPSDYGNKQSAVMEMQSAQPKPGQRFAAGLGLANARLFAEGSNDQFGWLFSARRGYVDLVLKLMNEDDNFRPIYYDAFGKFTVKKSDHHQISLNILWAKDDLEYRDKEEEDYDFFSQYGNTYAWIVWHATPSAKLHMRTLPYIGHFSTHRSGNTYRNPAYNGLLERVSDSRSSTRYGLKSDWTFQAHSHHVLRFGFDAQQQTAKYNYFRREGFSRFDTTQVALAPSTNKISAYLSDKWRVKGPLTADLGLRLDHHSHINQTHISPRAALALPIGNKTVLRAAYGHYYQSQSVDDLDIQYADQTFRPAEQATHYILGIEQQLPEHIQFRVEGYYKTLTHMRDRYEDVANQLELMPELHSDIAHLFPETGSVRGLEFYVKRDTGGRFNWWLSYTLSKASETHSDSLSQFAQISGKTYPQNHDQRHQFGIDIIFRPSPKWNISTAWVYRTGWPHTARHLDTITLSNGNRFTTIQYRDLYDDHYPPYHRLDVKLNRQFAFKAWKLNTSIGIINLYNRRNVRSYLYKYNAQNRTLTRTSETWFSRLPSFTLGAEF